MEKEIEATSLHSAYLEVPKLMKRRVPTLGFRTRVPIFGQVSCRIMVFMTSWAVGLLFAYL